MGDYITISADHAEKMWTCPSAGDPPPWPGAVAHTQWSGPGTRGDPVFDGMLSSMSPNLVDSRLQERTTADGCTALLDRIGTPVYLIAHSIGAPVGWLVADARPALTKAVVAVEPSGPPFAGIGVAGPRALAIEYGLTYTPLTYEPPVLHPKTDLVIKKSKAEIEGYYDAALQAEDPPPRKLVNLGDTPIAIITGEASRHALYDWATVAFLKHAGLSKTETILLGEKGIHGNGHMLPIEENSDKIAELILGWIKDH